MAKVKITAPLANAESLNDLDDDYEESVDPSNNNTNDIEHVKLEIQNGGSVDATDGKPTLQGPFLSQNTTPFTNDSNDIGHETQADGDGGNKIIPATQDIEASGACGDITEPTSPVFNATVDNASLSELQKLVQQSLDEYNNTVRGWLSSRIQQKVETEDVLIDLDPEDFHQNETVKEWAYGNIKEAVGEDTSVEELYDDILAGDKIQFNGPRDDKIDEVLKELHILGIENTKSFLNLSLPLDKATTITDQYGNVVKTLSIMDDVLARKKQFDKIKYMFGEDDPKIRMTFSETTSVFNQEELKQMIAGFLRQASDPNSEWACIQATIILNGHGSADGKIALAQDQAMGFDAVTDHISEVLTMLKDDTKSINLPFGVMVLNGLCHSYNADGLNQDNARIQVKYFTDTNKPKTTSTFELGGSYKDGFVVINAGHQELEQEARDQYSEDLDSGDAKKAAVDRFVPPEEESEKENEAIAPAYLDKGDATSPKPGKQDSSLSESQKGKDNTASSGKEKGQGDCTLPLDTKSGKLGKGSSELEPTITSNTPTNGVQPNSADGSKKPKSKKPQKGKKNKPLDATSTKCAKCVVM